MFNFPKDKDRIRWTTAAIMDGHYLNYPLYENYLRFYTTEQLREKLKVHPLYISEAFPPSWLYDTAVWTGFYPYILSFDYVNIEWPKDLPNQLIDKILE